MCTMLWVIGLVSTIIVFACSENSTREVNSGVDSMQAFQDTMMKWEQYMESSSEGLWEDSTEYNLEIERIHTFGGEDVQNPAFYDPTFVHITGDTLLITDRATQSLVCMDTTGTVLWKFGESGEGPGYFAGIGHAAVCGDTIAIVNNGLSFIELLDRGGNYIGRLSSIHMPQYISFIDSGRMLVFSKPQPGGDVHLVNIETDSILVSFGNGEWEEYPYNSSTYEIWGLYLDPDRVVYQSHFEKKLVFANIGCQSSYITDVRELPFSITPSSHSYNQESNVRNSISYPLYRSMFKGPHGMINTLLCNIMYDGNMMGPGNISNYAPVTVIDRFNKNGEYLDSYCLPDSAISLVHFNMNGYMVARQLGTGKIFGYRVFAEHQ